MFGGVVAALLPLGVGILAVVGTLLILTILVSLTEVSVFALNLTTGLGLGLAIDYSLFVVSRYREELADRRVDERRGRPHDADRGPHRRVQRGDRDDLARRAAALPGDLPALVRVRGRRGRVPRRDRVGRSCCPRSSPCSVHRVEALRIFKVEGRRREDGLLGPPGRAG